MQEHPFTWFEHFIPGVSHANLHVVTAALVVLALSVATLAIYPHLRNISGNVVPDARMSIGNLFGFFISGWLALSDDILGHHGRKYIPFFGTIFFFVFGCNVIGLIPGFLPATENWVTGAALATITFIAYNYFGFREHGIGYLKHFIAPLSMAKSKNIVTGFLLLLSMVVLHALFGAIELVGNLFRPVSLSVRLFANIFADHMVLGIFSGLVPWVVPIAFMGLGIIVSFMQAAVFALLSMIYISGAVAHEH